MYLEYLFCLLLTLLFGAALRLPFSMSENNDQWPVFMKIRKHVGKRWLDSSMPDSLTGGRFPSPMLVHYLISRFPERYWRGLTIVLNQGADIVTGVLVAITIILAGREFGLPPEQYLEMSWLGTALFLTTPLLFPVTARLRACNGRCFGLMVHTVYMLFLYDALSGNIISMIVAGGAFFVACLSSFFAMQSALAFSVGMSIWQMSLIPVLIPVGAIGFAFLFPCTYAREVIVFKVNHFRWYWVDLEKFDIVAARNLFNFIDFFKSFGKDHFLARNLFYRTSPVLISLYSIPIFWLSCALLAFNPEVRHLAAQGMGAFYAAAGGISLLLFIITSSGRFVIFGQAERYFEYSAPFVTAGLVLILQASGFSVEKSVSMLIFLNLAIIFFNEAVYSKGVFKWVRSEVDTLESDEVDMVERLLAIEGDVRVLTVPVKLSMKLTRHNREPERVKFYHRFIQHGLKQDAFADFQRDTVDLHTFAGTPHDFIARYKANYVIAMKSFISGNKHEFVNELHNLPVEHENASYILYRIVGSENGNGTGNANHEVSWSNSR